MYQFPRILGGIEPQHTCWPLGTSTGTLPTCGKCSLSLSSLQEVLTARTTLDASSVFTQFPTFGWR